MAVGSSSSGPTRWPLTAKDGDIIESFGPDHADIDTVSFFSSYGLTKDSRIKPEILAPGDQVRFLLLIFATTSRVSSPFGKVLQTRPCCTIRPGLARLILRPRERRGACRVGLACNTCPVAGGCLLVSLPFTLTCTKEHWDENTTWMGTWKTFLTLLANRKSSQSRASPRIQITSGGCTFLPTYLSFTPSFLALFLTRFDTYTSSAFSAF